MRLISWKLNLLPILKNREEERDLYLVRVGVPSLNFDARFLSFLILQR